MRRSEWVTRLWVLSLLWVSPLWGCDDDAADGEGGAGGYGDAKVHIELLDRLHLADVRSHPASGQDGLTIDFGTPSQAKYTVGDWRSGFLRRGVSEDATFAYVGKRARVYVPVDRAEALTVRVRLRPYGTRAVTPYVNNTQLQSIFFEGGADFQDVSFDVPAEHVVRGENYVLLAFGGSVAMGGEEISAALDRMWVGTRGASPVKNATVRRKKVKIDDEERDAVVTASPATISWYVQVPPHAELGFGVGAAKKSEGTAPGKAQVSVTPEGGKSAQLFSGEVGEEWRNERVDLSAFSGRVARIDFRGEAGSELAWSRPVVLTKPVERPEFDAPKNVVVLVEDTLRADKLKPFNAKSRVRTPVINDLAARGAVFEHAQSTENWTKPSVAGILTSLYPRSHGARTQASVLSESALMLSEHLKAQGLATGAFVANGYVSDRFGFKQGWDKFRNFIREGGSTEAEDVFSEAAQWVERNREKRFFLYVQTIDPHVPYDPDSKYLHMYDRRSNYAGLVHPRKTGQLLVEAKKNPPRLTFSSSDRRRLEALHDGEITQHDVALGRFVERLKKLGVWEDTLFVMTSDHGEEFSDHGSWGHGHSVYQELLHVPLVFHKEGVVPKVKVPETVSTIDIAPTVLHIMDLPALPNAEGRDLGPLMHGSAAAHPPVAFSEFLDERRVAVGGRYKFIVRGNLTASMFDLQADPGEQKQLALTDRPIAARYMRLMQGQFLGATNRAQWMQAVQEQGQSHETQDVKMDDTLKGQLEALGYVH